MEGRYRTHHETSVFLAALLGSPPHAKCSSINMAGMMELHRTEVGAVRLAAARELAAAGVVLCPPG